MKATLNETQLWYCNKCDETVNFKSKSKLFNSKSHKLTNEKWYCC